MSFHMKLQGKRLCNGHQAREILERELSGALKRAGLILQGLVMRYSPVLTGTLRRSWNVSEPEWVGNRFIVKVGSVLVYARIRNLVGKSKGYVDRAIEAARPQVKAAIQEGIRRALPQMKVAL